jgi:predicted RNase H-like nuclease (RuvC/YqgF family)
MDTEKLAALERHLTHLIQAFIRVKEDNARLTQSLAQLQQTVHEQQRSLERWQAAQEELTRLRLVAQTLQQERELIRDRLTDMLVAIERLEGLAHVPSGSQL